MVAAVVSVLAGAPAASAAGTVVNTSPQNAPQLALAKAGPSASFSLVVLQEDGPFANQKWTMDQVANLGGGRLAFTYTSSSGGCLDVNADSLQSGAALVVKPCDGTLSQRWIRDFSVNATFLKLENRNSGLIATADGGSSGTRVTQRADVGGFNQRWSNFGA
ncbi:RICIN domain-containing protein [Dactylosporangium sp. NPDC005555]|uniref:RICIN domain-containing protein n=1 Tax=Dactylosporangium sp. NPDC005555 TaxID=3154889 RepID=UPI0033AB6FEF